MAIVLASPAQPISLGPMEEAERKTYEQYQTPQTNQYTSSISREGSLRDKPASLGLDYEVDSPTPVIKFLTPKH
jgi:hypothetical protein